jgi:hypothetical protein
MEKMNLYNNIGIYDNNTRFIFAWLLKTIKQIFLFIILFVFICYLDGVTCCDSISNSANLGGENDQMGNLSSNINSLPLGIKCLALLKKYKNIGRRKLYYVSCVKGKGTFTSYNEFKRYWDPNTKIVPEIKRNIQLAKRTFDWFLKPSKRGGGRGL